MWAKIPVDKPNSTQNRLPLTLLTGFLGAGKTTLINRYLQSPEGAGTAVLVNEFGEIDVDGAVLGGDMGGERLMTLPNGCVCCEVQEDLAVAILQLADRGRADGIVRGVVETTGLADPGSILRGLAHDPRLKSAAQAVQTITVAAASTIANDADRFVEAAEQIALADRIVVTKADLVGEDAVSRTVHDLIDRNPLAQIEICRDGTDAAVLFRPPAQMRDVPTVDAHRHTHGIGTFAVRLNDPLDADLFRDVMSFWIMRHAERLLRIKGVLRFSSDSTARLLNVVHDVAEIVPIEHGGEAALVFIGIDLPEDEIRSDIGRCSLPRSGETP